MKWLGFKQVAVKSIVVDAPDIRARMKEQHVADLAADIRAHGDEPIHAPTIWSHSNSLLCGRDRFAALLLNKAKKVWVHVAECTEQEASEIELTENIYRRADNRQDLIAQLVALKEQQLNAAKSSEEAEMTRRAGGTVSPRRAASNYAVKAEARRQVAKAAGITPGAVKKAEQRAAAKKVSAPDGHGAAGDPPTGSEGVPMKHPSEAEPTLPMGFEAWDVVVHGPTRRVVASTTVSIGAWNAAVASILRELTAFERNHPSALPAAVVQKIRTAAQVLGNELRSAIPVMLCPYCKDRGDLRAQCYACGQSGLAGRYGGDNVPPELKQRPAMVAMGGAFVPFSAKVATVPRSAKPEKGITVTMADGTVLSGRELTIERDEGEAY